MRKYTHGIALVIMCLLLLGFENSAFSAFENKKYGFRIEIPTGFVMEGDWGKQTSWIYTPGPDEKFDDVILPIISVITSDIPNRFSASTLYNTKLKKVQEMIADKESGYEDLETLAIEGGQALMYKEINKNDSQALNHWYVNVYGNNRYYLIDISGTREQLRERRSELMHVIESFTLVP